LYGVGGIVSLMLVLRVMTALYIVHFGYDMQFN
jgi:hypothetical protein